jgi:hypothetical protein
MTLERFSRGATAYPRGGEVWRDDERGRTLHLAVRISCISSELMRWRKDSVTAFNAPCRPG